MVIGSDAVDKAVFPPVREIVFISCPDKGAFFDGGFRFVDHVIAGGDHQFTEEKREDAYKEAGGNEGGGDPEITETRVEEDQDLIVLYEFMKSDDGGENGDYRDHIVQKVGGFDEIIIKIEVERSLIVQKHLQTVKKVDDNIDKEKGSSRCEEDLPEDPVNVCVCSV